jgi:hypothetical protein
MFFCTTYHSFKLTESALHFDIVNVTTIFFEQNVKAKVWVQMKETATKATNCYKSLWNICNVEGISL